MDELPPFRVLVTASRTWDNANRIHDALDTLRMKYGARLVIVHGHCPTGGDAIADTWCLRSDVQVERHPADWETYGRSAGIIRNREMVAADINLVLAFIRDRSRGASHCTDVAIARGIVTVVYRYEGGARLYQDGRRITWKEEAL